MRLRERTKKTRAAPTISVADLKDELCFMWRRQLTATFGPRRHMPFDVNLALYIVRVLEQGQWFVDYALTANQRRFYARRMAGIATMTPGNEVTANYIARTLMQANALVDAYGAAKGTRHG